MTTSRTLTTAGMALAGTLGSASLAGAQPASPGLESGAPVEGSVYATVEKRSVALSGLVSPSFAASLALGGGALLVSDAKQASQGIGTPAAIPVSFRLAFLKYVFIDLGVGVGSAPDHGAVSQEACTVAGDCAVYDSSVSGFILSAKTGLALRAFFPRPPNAFQVALSGAFGHRGIHLSRKIPNCSDCTNDSLNIDGGVLVGPELTISNVWDAHVSSSAAIGLRFEYEHYLNGDVPAAVWINLFVEVM